MTKEPAALANHGGGYLIFGIDDDRKPQGACAYDLATFGEEPLTDVVRTYLDPLPGTGAHGLSRRPRISGRDRPLARRAPGHPEAERSGSRKGSPLPLAELGPLGPPFAACLRRRGLRLDVFVHLQPARTLSLRLRRMADRFRRPQDDDGLVGPPHSPLRDHRDRQRKLALQKPRLKNVPSQRQNRPGCTNPTSSAGVVPARLPPPSNGANLQRENRDTNFESDLTPFVKEYPVGKSFVTVAEVVALSERFAVTLLAAKALPDRDNRCRCRPFRPPTMWCFPSRSP